MARWYYNILYHPRIEIAVCLFTAGLLPYTNPRYGFFCVLCSHQQGRAETGEGHLALLGRGDYMQGAQADR